jgi:hypothetical protein
MPDLTGLAALGRELEDPQAPGPEGPAEGNGRAGGAQAATLCFLHELQEMPDLTGLTALGSLTIRCCHNLRALPKGIDEMGAHKQLTLRGLNELREMPDLNGLTALGSLTIDCCDKLNRLPMSVGELGSLKELTLFERIRDLEEYLPTLGWLSSQLQTFNIGGLNLKKLPACITELGALQHFILREARELTHLPDTLGRMTALERLTLNSCRKLRTLPASKSRNCRGCRSWRFGRPHWRTCRASRPSRRCMSFTFMSQTMRTVAAHSLRCRACCRAWISCKYFAFRASEVNDDQEVVCVALLVVVSARTNKRHHHRQGMCLPSAVRSRPGPCSCTTTSMMMMIFQRTRCVSSMCSILN